MPRTAQSALLMPLIRAIVSDQASEVAKLIEASPALARESLPEGATRAKAAEFYFKEIAHYLYAQDTALHAAAAGYRLAVAKVLVNKGANVAARNRRGAEPLHYAADGYPASRSWNPAAQ